MMWSQAEFTWCWNGCPESLTYSDWSRLDILLFSLFLIIYNSRRIASQPVGLRGIKKAWKYQDLSFKWCLSDCESPVPLFSCSVVSDMCKYSKCCDLSAVAVYLRKMRCKGHGRLSTHTRQSYPFYSCEPRAFVQNCLFSHSIIVLSTARNRAKPVYLSTCKETKGVGKTN